MYYFVFYNFLKKYFFHIGSKVFRLQSKIYHFSNSFELRKVFRHQKIFLTSLSARFYAVKYVFDDPILSSSAFSSFDKISLVFNLKSYFVFPPDNTLSIQFKKKSGVSHNFLYADIYLISLSFLLTLSLLPILESKSDRFSYTNRIFNEIGDSMFLLNYSLVSRKHLNYFFCAEVLNLLPVFDSQVGLLVKYIPLSKNVLSSFLKFREFSSNCPFRFSALGNFFDFIFCGLVRFGSGRI